MNVLALLYLLCFGITLFLGNFILRKNAESRLNRLFAWFYISAAYWAFTSFGLHQASDSAAARFWENVDCLWPFSLTLMLHFVLVFTEKSRLLESQLTHILLYVPASAISILDYFVRRGEPQRMTWGWTTVFPHEITLAQNLTHAWGLLIGLLAMILSVAYYAEAADPRTKEQARYVMIGLSMPLALGMVSEMIAPTLLSMPVPNLITLSFIPGSIPIGYAIWKHDLFALTPAKAATEIISTMSDALFLVDPGRRIQLVNQAALGLLGYEEDEVIGQPVDILCPEQDRECTETLFRELSVSDMSVHFKAKRGTNIPISLSSSAMWGMDGSLRGVVLICRDVTERKRAEEQLQRYAADLEQSNEEVQRFTYTISHHLRAPLVNLKGFTAELRATMQNVYPTLESALPHLGPSQQQAVTAALYENIPEALDFIDASTTRINELSNAVLRLSNLGRCQLRLEPVDMHALVQTTLQTLADQIEEHQGQVTVGPLPEVVADRGAIEQIVGHILDNAVKYAHPGRPLEIEITAEHNHTETFFHVRDNGRGIAEDDVEKVFAPFRRAGRTDVPGQGLGLSTAQTLVRRHGGRMWYESEPGVGATFSFSISDQLEEGVCHP